MGYREITEALICDIKAGLWAVDSQLPTEMELVQRFGASRNTVREGLRALDTAGFIKRRRGTRSILIATNPADSFVNSARSIDELLQYSSRAISRPLSVDMIVATGALAERLGATAGSCWLRAQILRMPMTGSLPIGVSEIYVAERYAGIADRLGESRPVYELIEAVYGIDFARVEQTIEAAAATIAIAGLLQVQAGSPLLAVRTEFVTEAGELAEIGFGHFPAGRYRMKVVLERGGQPPRATAEDST